MVAHQALAPFAVSHSDKFCTNCGAAAVAFVNLPGWCWAEIQQLALVGSSSSLHSEACNALGASDGVIHSRISLEAVSLRAAANNCSTQVHIELLHLLHHPLILLRPFFWSTSSTSSIAPLLLIILRLRILLLLCFFFFFVSVPCDCYPEGSPPMGLPRKGLFLAVGSGPR